jgi:head-tail adaptor
MITYVHDLVIERVSYDEGTLDEARQPTAATSTTAVKGLVQPRAVREMPDPRSAGAEVGDHVIFLPIATDIRHADRVTWDDRRLNVVGVRRFDFGALRHLEVDAQLVTATPVTAAPVGS